MANLKFFSKGMAILLTITLVLAGMPWCAQAADDEHVLTGLSYTLADPAETINATIVGYDITLVVPYKTPSAVDLSSGIDIEYNASLYQAVHQPYFPDISVATVDGAAVLMKVTYQGINSTSIDTTTYNVWVQRASYNEPEFSGTISKEITLPEDSVEFAAADFTSRYTANDGEGLGSIVIRGSNPSFGSFRLNGAAYDFGDLISLADIAAGQLVFRATDIGSASFSVDAYQEGDEDTAIGRATLSIRVYPQQAPDILYSAEEGNVVKFRASDFTSACTDTTGQALSYVQFTLPPTTSGRLYYNYSASSGTGTTVNSTTKYYAASSPNIGNITFVPSSSFSGTAVINYTGYTTDFQYTGKIKITITASLVEVINYTTDEDEEITFDSDDFNAVCQKATGSNLSYVKFTLPSSSYGRLYYNYVSSSSYDSRVTATEKYYRSGSPDLDKVSFVPYTNFNGTVTITYNGYATNGKYYTGKIKVTVKPVTGAAETIIYSTDEDEAIAFDSDDFNEVCQDVTGDNLSYVKFSLPSTTYGRLYYEYVSASNYDSRVTATAKYYRSTSPDLDYVSFVPASGFKGTVTLSYTGFSTGGESYSGKIKITVGEGTTSTTINYSTEENTKLTFDSDDFNEVCRDVTGENLSYVKFTLPSTSYGRLYYRYVSASNYDSRVTTTTKYYRSISPDLDYVSFVPASGFDGTVTLSYTGYSSGGESYSGKIKITVGKGTTSTTVSYSTEENSKLTFDSDDFNEVCQDETGDNLSYVKFTLPSTTYGRLYYKYVSASNYDSRVTAATKYYRSTSPDLDYVSFVPASGFNGTVTISYTGYSTRGESFNGKIRIYVTPAIIANVSKYFVDVNASYSWAAPYIDYLYEQGVVAGTGTGRYSPAAQVTRGDFMLMLYNALDLSASNVQGNFPDVPKGSYYYQAIAVARALGIAQGSGGYFWPSNAITREESMALVARALAVKGRALPAGSYSVLSSFYDRNLISNYALSAVISLVSADVINGYNRYLRPRATTTRAEMAVILYRVMHL